MKGYVGYDTRKFTQTRLRDRGRSVVIISIYGETQREALKHTQRRLAYRLCRTRQLAREDQRVITARVVLDRLQWYRTRHRRIALNRVVH